MKWTKRNKVTFLTDCDKILTISVGSGHGGCLFLEMGAPSVRTIEVAEAATPSSLVSW